MGLYVATPRVLSGRIATDIYYFDHRRALARFDPGFGREHRYTVGIRVWGDTAAFLYDIDGIVQRGSFGDTRIAAWAVAADLESALLISRGRPRLGLRIDVGSGNKSQTRTLETFHPLYPRGPEVSDAPLVGASNRIAVRPFVGVSPHRTVTVVAEFATLWRQSTNDGLYGQGGELVLPSGATPARLISHQLSVSGRWALDRHAAIRASGSHFWAGPFLSAITPGRNLRFGTVLLEYRF